MRSTATSFKFYDSGSRKGQGITGVDDKKIYIGGKLQAADSDEKINFFVLDAVPDTPFVAGDKVTVADLIREGIIKYDHSNKNGDEDYYYPVEGYKTAEEWTKYFIAINTTGTLITSGTKKDGDDYKINFQSAPGTSVLGKNVKSGYIKEIKLK